MFSVCPNVLSTYASRKVQVSNDQEKAQSKQIPTPKTEVGKTKPTFKYLYHENIS